jgi:NAD(P)H-nitrite reductase large subunit
VSEEQHPVYSRVLLPHYVKGKIPRERVFLKKETWYGEQNIEWLTGVRATNIDVKNQSVALSDGRELPYDKLLIATGGEIRTLPFERRGVAYLRTIDDTDHLLQLLGERTGGERGGVYGGGFIACEFVNAFAHHSLPTKIAFRGPHFWSNLFDEQMGALVNDRMRSQGVEVLPGTLISDELFADCSIVGIGIGIEPDFSILKDAGIEIGGGVKTNEFLETNAPNVWAAGDIAEYFDTIVGRHLLVGNWMNAQMQGRAVAANMAGEKKPFQLVSSYATNILGLEIIFVGDVNRQAAEDVVVHGSAAAGGVTQMFLRNGKIVGAAIVGRNMDRAPITKAIQTQSGPPTLA